MTTITTADLRHSFPRRMRRTAIAALAAAALYAPTALIVGHINNDNPHRAAATTKNQALDACGGEFGWICAVASPVAAQSIGTTSASPAAFDACGGDFGWVCAYANPGAAESVGTTDPAVAAAEVCRGGLEWACAFTPELGQE